MTVNHSKDVSNTTRTYTVGVGSLSGFMDSRQYRPVPGVGQLADLTWLGVSSSSRLDIHKHKLRWGGEWLTHDARLMRKYATFGPPHYEFDALALSDLPDGMKSELIRFLLTLKLWETTPGEKIISAAEVWLLSLEKGPAAAEMLDDMFALTWREREMPSYNFCFPARFLPRWKEGSSDIEYSLARPVSDLDEVECFYDTLCSVLEETLEFKEYIQLASDEQVLFDRTTTTSYVSSTGRKMPHWEASFIRRGFAQDRLEALRAVVNVYPGGTRDTIIADKSANNSVRWLDRSIINILTFIPESAETRYPSSYEFRKKDVVKRRGWHVLRDIKKCGLTYNVKDLFPKVEQALQKYYPDPRWSRIRIFQDMVVHDQDYDYFPQRGYGLGMANALVTLCNIVIHRMTLARLTSSNRVPSFKCKAIFGNDDADVCIWSEHDHDAQIAAAEYMEVESEIQAWLGNRTNPTKSVIKPYGLFYEEYNKRGWTEKESLVCNAIACAYLAPDIRVAKHYIYSQSERFSSKWAQEQLHALATWWGEEFYDVESELSVHYDVGGWLDLRTKGLKTSLLDAERLIEKGVDIRYVSWVSHVCSLYVTGPVPLHKKEEFVSNPLYTGQSFKSDPRIQLYTLGDSDIIDFYKRLTTFQRRFDKRLENFLNRPKSFVLEDDFPSLCRFLVGKTPWHAIPESLDQWDYNSGTEIALDVTSELATTDRMDQSPEKLIEYALHPERVPYEFMPYPINETATLPEEGRRVTVYCDFYTWYNCSQFSNSGALPIYEYYLRVGRVPCPIQGIAPCKYVRRNEPVERKILRSSFFSFEKKIEDNEEIIPSSPEEDCWGEEDYNLDESDNEFILDEQIDLIKEKIQNTAPDEGDEDLFGFDFSSDSEKSATSEEMQYNRRIESEALKDYTVSEDLLEQMLLGNQDAFTQARLQRTALIEEAYRREASSSESESSDYGMGDFF